MKPKGIEKILVTGGAGFIGSHTVDLLIERGYAITILDNLEPQVHGETKKPPDYINKNAAFVYGDIRDHHLLEKMISEADAVIHLAAVVGLNQSMYQIEKYIDINTKGTATLLDILVSNEHDVKKLVIASSISVYGEGRYYCEKCKTNVYPGLRGKQEKGRWDHACPTCGTPLTPTPTNEEKPLMPTSIYGLSKRHQEEMCLLTGKTCGIPAVALRYANVYGSRQALSNPYTGVCAIFSCRILNNNPPYVFEDGKQMRDFIHVKDVARANMQALECNDANYVAVNVGTGSPTSIRELAETLVGLYGAGLKPYISNTYRVGDVRHLYVDVQRMQRLLKFKSTIPLRDGLSELTEWAISNRWATIDLFDTTIEELKERQPLRKMRK